MNVMTKNVMELSSEKKLRKHPILSKPILACVLLMTWGIIFCQNLASIVDKMTFGILGKYMIAAILAVVALGIHKLWFRGEYKGSFSRNWLGEKDLRVCFLAVALIDLVLTVISYARFGIALSLTAIPLALAAGFSEEVSVRALPVSVMMRDWMDEKHVVPVAVITSVIFGLIHFANMAAGASFSITVFQVICAIGIGLFFAAVYLRTGNILLTILFHAVHDYLSFIIAGITNTTGVMTDASLNTFDVVTGIGFAIICIVVGFYLIRKSVRPQIVEVWKERWNR